MSDVEYIANYYYSPSSIKSYINRLLNNFINRSFNNRSIFNAIYVIQTSKNYYCIYNQCIVKNYNTTIYTFGEDIKQDSILIESTNTAFYKQLFVIIDPIYINFEALNDIICFPRNYSSIDIVSEYEQIIHNSNYPNRNKKYHLWYSNDMIDDGYTVYEKPDIPLRFTIYSKNYGEYLKYNNHFKDIVYLGIYDINVDNHISNKEIIQQKKYIISYYDYTTKSEMVKYIYGISKIDIINKLKSIRNIKLRSIKSYNDNRINKKYSVNRG